MTTSHLVLFLLSAYCGYHYKHLRWNDFLESIGVLAVVIMVLWQYTNNWVGFSDEFVQFFSYSVFVFVIGANWGIKIAEWKANKVKKE